MVGDRVLFSVVVSGDPEPAISWYHNGNPIDSDKIVIINPYNCLSINSIEPKDGGVYRMYARNSGGSVMDEFKLKVRHRHSEKDLVRMKSFREWGEQMAAEQYEMHMKELHHGLPEIPSNSNGQENTGGNPSLQEVPTIDGNQETPTIDANDGHPDIDNNHDCQVTTSIDENHGLQETTSIDDNNYYGHAEIDDNHDLKETTNIAGDNHDIHETTRINDNHGYQETTSTNDNYGHPQPGINDTPSLDETNLDELNNELATNTHPV